MKSLFHAADCESLRKRFSELQPDSPRHWGRMDPAQMLGHCAEALEGVLEARRVRRPFLWRLVGPLLKPAALGPRPFLRNLRAPRGLAVADRRVFDTELRRLAHLLDHFVQRGPATAGRAAHPFFGPLSGEEWGRLMYKHLDHHLRQFGM
ncbi:MAG TPA: DUF1569 domain-containing protein [Holophagaceae bacterium]